MSIPSKTRKKRATSSAKSRSPHAAETVSSAAEPNVGIFWLVEGKLLVKSAPLSEVPAHADFKDHEVSHVDYWEELVGRNIVPFGTEYDEFPRGRVVYNVRTNRFTVMLDRCIRNKPAVVSELVQRLHLPQNAFNLMEDSHYRCPACLHGESM